MTASSEPLGGTAASPLGARLRAAREAARLDPQGLAQLVYLDVKVINALEQGDYAALPPPLFIKGYLRSIAKQLGADANLLLASYEQERAHIEDPKLVGFSSRPAIQLTSSSLRVRAITAGLVLTLLVLVGIWWRTYYYAPADVVTPAMPAPATNAFDLPLMTAPVGDGAMPESGAMSAESPDFFQPDAAEPIPTTDAAAPVAPDAGDLPPASLQPAPPQSSPVAGTPAAPVQPGDVTLELTEAVWVSITDARGERLFYDTARAGQIIAVTGAPPYQLVIGNTQGVRLFFGGEGVDLSSYQRQGVARLTLGSTSGDTSE